MPDGTRSPDPEDNEQAALAEVARRYAVAITPAMAALIDPADQADPIVRQFLPDAAELETQPGELADPIGDVAHSPVRGIVHRYPDRVLLKLLHACPVYCRFCFRREMVGPGGEALSPGELAAALDYIRERPAIWEAILTGGDPLLLSPRRLGETIGALDAIDHLGVIRLHTRVPTVAPERITPPLLAALATDDKAVWLALHVNHPRELTPAGLAAIRDLARAGVALVSQTVLLKGVNDDAATLETLFRALVKARVKPYYLHHADLAPGTAHFRTTLGAGQALVAALRGRLSGLCQPSYVLDIPGGHGKVPVGPCHLEGSDAGGWRVTDPAGRAHAYPPLRD
ncbi:MAG: lysine-2,3-aminomutase-like protein [Inquilinus sp.]|nr:lysine-2,3-aminomutase-like protein [Inquilinus sp.]